MVSRPLHIVARPAGAIFQVGQRHVVMGMWFFPQLMSVSYPAVEVIGTFTIAAVS